MGRRRVQQRDLFDTIRPNSEWPALLRAQALGLLEALLAEAISATCNGGETKKREVDDEQNNR